jgi:putative nucleotidyltransferase with HDIG domain
MPQEIGTLNIFDLEHIPAGVLSSFKPSPFDLFVCEKGSNCILLCQRDYKIADSKLKELRLNKADIFVKKEDVTAFRSYLKKSIKELSSNPNLNREEKSQMIYSTAVMVVDELFNNIDSKESVEDSKALANVVLNDILRDDKTFLSMVSVLSYDYYTYSHCVNVCIYAIAIGKKLLLDDRGIEELAHAAILHDIGKSKIDSSILNKTGALSSEEFEIMKTHTTLGVDVLEALSEKNQIILDCVLDHHEKMDGSGYPHGINRFKIPFFAQIIAVADIFDALTTKRSYKEAIGSFAALRIMRDRMSIGLNEAALNALIQSFRP